MKWALSITVLLILGCSNGLKHSPYMEPKEGGYDSSGYQHTGNSAAKEEYGKGISGFHPKLPGYLDQNWDYATRLRWWFMSQGSRLLPYTWFLALERPDSKELVRSRKNLEQYRFIAWPADPKWNPEGLPIGLAIDKDAKTGKRYFGFTCAACHTGKIAYNGKEYLVEGGPAHLDFDRFITEITTALKMTLADEQKFSRFANRILGKNAQSRKVDALKDALTRKSIRLNVRVKTNQPPYPYGYARLDAYGSIFNEVSVFAINEPSNAKPSNAPVSFPVLWDTPQHDVVQWNGSAVNAGIGPYTRNVGEVVGVFGDLQVEEVKSFGKKKLRYHSYVNIKNLERLEETLTSLWSPVWPEGVLPIIDRSKAMRGKQHYDKKCRGCHQHIDREDPNRKITAKLIPVDKIGTDPTAAVNIATRIGKTGLMEGQLMIPITKYINGFGFIDTFGSTAPTRRIIGNGVIGVIREKMGFIKLAKGLPDYIKAVKKNALFPNCNPKKDRKKCIRPPRYKARPLNGAWASAPFLHNGSVPNLWELLQTPGRRVDTFSVGSWVIDPKKVGYVIGVGEATSLFDTSQPGNSNKGHDYGTELRDEEKWDLIEYIKTL